MIDENPTASPESLAAEFHVASRNSSAYKRMYKAYDIHHEPAVRDLVTDAPLHFTERTRVSLPGEDAAVQGTVLDAIRSRASGRHFRDEPLPLSVLATLLRHANGVLASSESADGAFYRRAAANSGDLGSVEIYPIILNVEGLAPGMYHFDTVRHDLTELRLGQYRDWLRESVLFQIELSSAAVALVLTSAIGRLEAKYNLRGYRFALLDVGHVSQNLYLVAAALGVQVCATAGFIDDTLDAALELDGLNAASALVVLVGM